MMFNKSLLKIVILFGCISLTRSTSEESTNANVQLDLNGVSKMKLAYESGRNFLGQKLGQMSELLSQVKSGVFNNFMKLYNKQYSASEIPQRMKLFFQRKKQIDESNKLYEQGKVNFEMKVNKFTDMNESELRQLDGVRVPPVELMSEEERAAYEEVEVEGEEADEDGVRESKAPRGPDKLDRLLSTIPKSKDWRDSGCLGELYSQLSCGSCYGIHSLNVVDAMLCIKGHSSKPLNLSAQEIVDCARKDYKNDGWHNEGCTSGWPTSVFRYLQEKGSVLKDECYPYAAKENEKCEEEKLGKRKDCRVDVRFGKEKLEFKFLRGEREILYHVATVGPVVTVLKTTSKYKEYSKGIFEDPDECINKRSQVSPAHAVTIVGYGQEKGVDYWLVRNSWGSDWGMDGYGKHRRGIHACSIGFIGWAVTS